MHQLLHKPSIMELVVDLQGFIVEDTFIAKEIAYASLASSATHREICEYLLFKPPCGWQNLSEADKKTNSWLIKFHHGIPWDLGVFNYIEVVKELEVLLHEENVTRVYVKGLQKIQWLRNFIGEYHPIVNLEDYGCPTLDKMNSAWKHPHVHKPLVSTQEPFCAFKNVSKMKKWFEQNWGVWPKPGLTDAPSLLTMAPENLVFLKPKFLFDSASHVFIDEVWDKLPDHLKSHPKIASCRRCRVHLNWPVDEPIPMRKDCAECIKEEDILQWLSKIYI